MTTHEVHESVVYNAVRAMFPDAEFTVENDDEPFLVIKTNLMFCGDTGEMLIGAVNVAPEEHTGWVPSGTRIYCVQYEIEYEDGPSDNDVQVVKASSEDEAMSIFNLYYADIVLHGQPRSSRRVQNVSANAAWLDYYDTEIVHFSGQPMEGKP